MAAPFFPLENSFIDSYGGFYALRIGLLSSGKGSAGFRQFRYRNAIPQEKDMGAYLMVFHKDETHSLYMAVSDDGYTFTALRFFFNSNERIYLILFLLSMIISIK